MTTSKKQIADHHDNVIRFKVESENIIDEFSYYRDKVERDILYLSASRDRVVAMKISNYDKIIDLEMFFLKLFIPILSISFAAGVNIIGIDTYILKRMSLLVIILVGLLIVVTLISRKRIVDSESKYHERVLDLIRTESSNNLGDLKARCDKVSEAIKLDL